MDQMLVILSKNCQSPKFTPCQYSFYMVFTNEYLLIEYEFEYSVCLFYIALCKISCGVTNNHDRLPTQC